MRRLAVVLAVAASVVLAAVPGASAEPLHVADRAGGASASRAPDGASVSSRQADQLEVVAHHVRYRRSLLNWKENPDFAFWKNAGGLESCRERIWIGEVWKPRPGRIRNVIFVSAGQQGTRYTWSAEANITTGQSEAWRGAKDARTHTVPIRRLSVAGLIHEDGVSNEGRRYGFKPEDTLFVLVFDAAFYYSLDATNKQIIENGYYDYLLDRMGPLPDNVQTVLMVGSSRGGALACRLAKRFMGDSSPVRHARILVATLDAVANKEQSECGITTGTTTNPLNGSYRAYKAALSDYFGDPTPEWLSMYQVIGGAKVVPLQPTNVARAFINDGTPTFDYSFNWVDRGHTDIGRPWRDDCSGALLDWVAAKHGMAPASSPTLSRPSTPSKVKRGQRFVVSGTFKPRFPAGTEAVTVKAYRRVAGKWRLFRRYRAVDTDAGTLTRYRARVSITTRGRYRFRAFARSSAEWRVAGSGFSRTLTVR